MFFVRNLHFYSRSICWCFLIKMFLKGIYSLYLNSLVDSIIEFSSWVGLLGAVVFQNNFSVCVGKRSKGSYNWFPWRIHPPTLHHFSSLKFSNFGHETVRIFGTWWSWERICQFSKPHLRLSFYSFFFLCVFFGSRHCWAKSSGTTWLSDPFVH